MITATRVIIGVAVAVVAVAFTLALPLAAQAQSGDAAYCKALTDKYRTYVTPPGRGSGAHGNAAVETAIAQCTSDPQRSIPAIEGALKDAKIDLPPRG